MSVNNMNILMAVNKKYVQQMKVLLCSLGMNHDVGIDIYLMHSELTKDILEDLERFTIKWCKGRLHQINVGNSFLRNAKVLLHFSVEMYYRIFASEFLPKELDRILWLDADIIVKDSILNFYNRDFLGKSIIACAHREMDERNSVVNRSALTRLGLSEDTCYFNSGVILMDLQKMRREFNREEVCAMVENCSGVSGKYEIIYPDQDILNILYQHDITYADKSIYNYQVHHNWKYDGEKEYIDNCVKILHYAGPVKPWGYQTYHFSYEYYWDYYLKFGRYSNYIKNKVLMICYKVFRGLKRIGKDERINYEKAQ